MKSTDMNINNPLNVDRIDLQRTVDRWRTPNVEIISQSLYDLIATKDPMTIYVIHDSADRTMYMGDMLIREDKVSCRYLLGVHNNKYVIYMNTNTIYPDMNRLVPIASYDDLNVAMDTLNRYNNVKSHNKVHLSIYNALSSYIDKFIGLNDLIVSIIALYGYKNDPRLQKVIHVYSEYHENSNTMMSELFLTNLPSFAGAYHNQLFNYYNELYKVIEKYNFFKGEVYHKGELIDLSSAVSDIENVMTDLRFIDVHQ